MRIRFAMVIVAVILTGCQQRSEEVLAEASRTPETSPTPDANRSSSPDELQNDEPERISWKSPFGESSDSTTNVFWKIGYNRVRTDAPIHLHFAESLPVRYGIKSGEWDWGQWELGTTRLLKEELFPLIGAYEHHYFLIDYEQYDGDDEEIVALVREIGDSPRASKDSFTGISGMHIKPDGWRVPLHMSRIPDGTHMTHVLNQQRFRRPEESLVDQLRSSVVHEYHHVMMWHQMMNNYQSRNSGGTAAEPDYVPPWFGEGAAAVLPYLLGTDGGRDGLRQRIDHVLEMVKSDDTLDFDHLKEWETWTKPPLSFDPFIPVVCYMAHRTDWQLALVDSFRAMGLQPYPGDFDALLVSLVGVNEHDFLNEALAFFRLDSTTSDTLMPPDVPVDELIGPPTLTELPRQRTRTGRE